MRSNMNTPMMFVFGVFHINTSLWDLIYFLSFEPHEGQFPTDVSSELKTSPHFGQVVSSGTVFDMEFHNR
ncbi:protein of unknown function [Pseudodesulfovibrio profundus]|uniref:Uncharacterized protein n=1 Tax=Pseudodesulfovibrio profundus TaxID=57320 RepID=A0A2C8F8H1_9BACT|nr:protein of unknown function [Pseudodesulfovibrio profundus]